MKVPKSALLFKNTDEGSVEIFAEGDGEKNRFRLVGNSGKPFGSDFFGKVIIDFENLKLRKSPLVVLREHDPLLIAGTSRRTDDTDELVFEGKFSKVTETASEIKELLSEGVKFESSIRVEPKAIDFIDKGEEAEVNGQIVKGPIRILRDNLVSEASFVLFGRDRKTSGKLVAAEDEEVINITELRKEFIMSENNSPQLTEKDMDEARQLAAKDEQQRIMSITTEIAGDELAEVRTKAIKEGLSLAEAKAEAFEVQKKAHESQLSRVQTDRDTAQQRLDAIAAGGTELLAQEDAEANADGNASANAANPDLYLNELNRLMDTGKSGGQAVILASQRFPDAHEAWIKKQPLSNKGSLPQI